MERDELLKQLSILDFWAVDLQLYLDTHPDDKEAIQKYNEINIEAAKVRSVYEMNFGPLCSYRSLSNPDIWSWGTDELWPWNKDFNFESCR